MGLCVLALLCQMLALPVMAAPSVASAAAGDAALTTGTVGTSDDGIGYKEYVAQYPGDPATEDITIPAVDALLGDAETEPSEGETSEEDAPAAADATEAVTKVEDGLIFNVIDASAQWNVEVPKTAWYKVGFTYSGVEGSGSGSDMELSLLVDGVVPYAESQNFVLRRIWTDVVEDYNGDGIDDYVREDPKGNQFAPEQQQLFTAQKAALRDANGFVTEDLCLYLTEGVHSLTLAIHLDISLLKSLAQRIFRHIRQHSPNVSHKLSRLCIRWDHKLV